VEGLAVESERVDVAVSFCFSLRLRLGLVLADFLSRYFSVNPETLFLGKTTNQTLESPEWLEKKKKKNPDSQESDSI
jgi:hypothetical protein